MKNIELNIVLDKDDGIYTTNDYINGKMVLKINERTKINGIKFLFTGTSKVSFSDPTTPKTTSTTTAKYNKKLYNSYEEYIHLKRDLLETREDLYLEISERVFLFQIKLSDCLPCSFEHSFGYIRYIIDCMIDIPWGFDKHVKKIVTIIKHLDLSLRPVLLNNPVSASETCVDTSYVCCKTKAIAANLNVKKGGYVCGDIIEFNAFVQNNSSKDIKHTSVALVQMITFYAKGKLKCVERYAVEIILRKVISSSTTDEWSNGQLSIPSLAPTLKDLSQIINITYLVVLSLHVSSKLKFKVEIPIEIGTIPIQNEDDETKKRSCSFVECVFGPAGKNENLEVVDSGETINLDHNEYVPSYPYSKM